MAMPAGCSGGGCAYSITTSQGRPHCYAHCSSGMPVPVMYRAFHPQTQEALPTRKSTDRPISQCCGNSKKESSWVEVVTRRSPDPRGWLRLWPISYNHGYPAPGISSLPRTSLSPELSCGSQDKRKREAKQMDKPSLLG